MYLYTISYVYSPNVGLYNVSVCMCAHTILRYSSGSEKSKKNSSHEQGKTLLNIALKHSYLFTWQKRVITIMIKYLKYI